LSVNVEEEEKRSRIYVEITLNDTGELLFTTFDTSKPTRDKGNLPSNSMECTDYALILDDRKPAVMHRTYRDVRGHSVKEEPIGLTSSERAVFTRKGTNDDPSVRRPRCRVNGKVAGMRTPSFDVITKSVSVVLVLAWKYPKSASV